MSKQYIKYEIDGETVYVEAESIASGTDDDISRDSGLIEGGKFETAIQSIKPVANAVLGILKELNDLRRLHWKWALSWGQRQE